MQSRDKCENLIDERHDISFRETRVSIHNRAQLGCCPPPPHPRPATSPYLTHDQQRLVLRLRHQIQLVVRLCIIHGRLDFGSRRGRRWHRAAGIRLVCAASRRLRHALGLLAGSVKRKTQSVCVWSDASKTYQVVDAEAVEKRSIIAHIISL